MTWMQSQLLVLGVALLIIGGLLIWNRGGELIEGALASLDHDGEPDPLADDLTAIIAALQDGRIDAPEDVREFVECALHELEFGAA